MTTPTTTPTTTTTTMRDRGDRYGPSVMGPIICLKSCWQPCLAETINHCFDYIWRSVTYDRLTVQPRECAVEVDAFVQGINRTLSSTKCRQHSLAHLRSNPQLPNGTAICSHIPPVLSVKYTYTHLHFSTKHTQYTVTNVDNKCPTIKPNYRTVNIQKKHFMTTIRVDRSLRSASTVRKNWRILLKQSVIANIPLLVAASTFGLWRRCWSSPVYYLNCFHTTTIKTPLAIKLQIIKLTLTLIANSYNTKFNIHNTSFWL